MSEEAQELEVPAAAAGERLDRFLAGQLGLPRNQIQGWIRAGRVAVGGTPARASRLLEAGERLRYTPLERSQEGRVEAEPGELAVLYEDASLVVLDKPAGLVVHPGAGRGSGTLAHFLLGRYPEMAGVGGAGRPGIVHRLDLGTSGLLLVARSHEAYLRLSADFAARRIRKLYLGVAYGGPPAGSGRIEAPIGRHPSRRKEMTVKSDGRPAATSYRLLASARGLSLLALELHTGRTHQIRVHLKSLGLPLVGDPVYGEARWRGLEKALESPLKSFSRPALHAWQLRLAHPQDGRPLAFTAPPPADLEELWRRISGEPLAMVLARSPEVWP
ncbi:MAG TPA: RluA family pseudouridine synthase [Thermoanaerobaculia bacterium]|nr:RluA family pseudouridine synthase [Thermoanaerobaculia bacterium]